MAISRLEDWAVTKIQALARGAQGRGKAAARRLEHMARWKEMYDDDRGANFYYNKASVRCSLPQTSTSAVLKFQQSCDSGITVFIVLLHMTSYSSINSAYCKFHIVFLRNYCAVNIYRGLLLNIVYVGAVMTTPHRARGHFGVGLSKRLLGI